MGLNDPQRQNLTTSMVGLKNGHLRKNLTKMVNPRDIAGNTKEEEGPNWIQEQLQEHQGLCSCNDDYPLLKAPHQPLLIADQN